MSDRLLQAPRVRDGKRLGLERGALVPFLQACLVTFPMWLGVMLPLTIVSRPLVSLAQLLGGGKKKGATTAIYTCPPELEARLPAPGAATPLADRTYDVVLLGATGFTGRLAVKYLAERYGGSGDVRWAIAGRREAALQAIKAEHGLGDEVGVVVCDTSSPETLVGLVSDTRCVATTAGPFDLYGMPVVHMCAAYGTAYADITGETDWVRQVIDRYDDLARSTGARIVHHCGHDCVPWDLAAKRVADVLRDEHGQALSEIRFYDEINSEASGGTIATLFHSLDGRVRYKAALGFDPLLKTRDGAEGGKLAARNQSRLGYSDENKSWVGPFVMASVMANCVRRSNAVNGYTAAGKRLVYKEAVVFPGFMAGFVSTMYMLAFGTALYCPPLKWLLRKFVLPKPGQGPSVKKMDHGWLNVKAIGVGDGGAKVTMQTYFPTDPGYRDTARMLVESALALSLDNAGAENGGGVFTPAACIADRLLERLEATGTEVTMG